MRNRCFCLYLLKGTTINNIRTMNDIKSEVFTTNDYIINPQVIKVLEEDLPVKEDLQQLINLLQKFPIMDKHTERLKKLLISIDLVDTNYAKKVISRTRLHCLSILEKKGITPRCPNNRQ